MSKIIADCGKKGISQEWEVHFKTISKERDMGKYDNLMNEDVFEVFGEENVNKALDVCTQTTDKAKYYYRDDFVKKLKEHDRFTTAVLVLTLLKEKIIIDKELDDFYDNDLGNELRTGRYLPCC